MSEEVEECDIIEWLLNGNERQAEVETRHNERKEEEDGVACGAVRCGAYWRACWCASRPSAVGLRS